MKHRIQTSGPDDIGPDYSGTSQDIINPNDPASEDFLFTFSDLSDLETILGTPREDLSRSYGLPRNLYPEPID